MTLKCQSNVSKKIILFFGVAEIFFRLSFDVGSLSHTHGPSLTPPNHNTFFFKEWVDVTAGRVKLGTGTLGGGMELGDKSSKDWKSKNWHPNSPNISLLQGKILLKGGRGLY